MGTRRLLCVAVAIALSVLPTVGAARADEAPAATGEWLAGDLHAHTTYSHDSYGGPEDDNTGLEEGYTLGHTVGSHFTVAAARGLDFLAITDHNDVRSQSDPAWGSLGVIGLPAYENSLDGHAQMLGATTVYDHGSSASEVAALADRIRADGGAFQINHPGSGGDGDLDWSYGYDVVPDAVEVWNISRLHQPPLPSASSNDEAVSYWEGWLDRGFRVAATGGSDNHYLATTAVQGVGQPTTHVFAADRSVAGILAGIRAGRTTISHQPPAHGGPQLFLEADGDGDGGFEAMVGDTVEPGAVLRVRAHRATGSFLRVVTDGGRLEAEVPVLGPEWEHEFTVPSDRTWVRVELFAPDLAPMRAALCPDAVAGTTTYCRDQLLVTALTSALFLRPAA